MMNPVMEHRIGTFRIDADWLRNDDWLVRNLLENMIVVRAEMRYDTNCIHYTAFNPSFEPAVKNGSVIETPEYEATITKVAGGDPMGSAGWTYEVEWKRL